MIDFFTDMEKALIALSSTLSFTAGLWAGIWLLPDEALDVPKQTVFRDGQAHVNAAFTPVPNALPIVSILIIAIGLYLVWISLRVTETEDQA